MSTKGSIAYIELKEKVGNKEFHSSLHFYQECFDEENDVHIECWEQGVFNNHTFNTSLPLEQAKGLIRELNKWLEMMERSEKKEK